MLSKVKTVLVLAVVAAAALAPLFGDPRKTPVTHPLWARMLLRAMDMSDAVKVSSQASQVFATLSWKDSLTYPADSFSKGDGIAVREQAGRKEITVASGVGEVVYPLAVVQGGDYRLRFRMSGPPTPATAEIAPLGGSAVKSFAFTPTPAVSWVSATPAHLDPGTYSAAVMLPSGSTLEYVEVAPPCVSPIEPPGGWKPETITSVDDVATTALRAMDLESELPPADTPIEVSGAEFAPEDPTSVQTGASEQGFEGTWLRAGQRGVRAIVTVDIPEPGLYTLSGFLVPGSGQSWVADGCRKEVICPSTKGAAWRAVMTQSFSAGRHSVAVTLLDGAAVERLRLERKKDKAADYAGTLRRLGYDPGSEGAVTREKAVEAMRFVEKRRAEMVTAFCGDVRLPAVRALPPDQLVATTGAGAGADAGGAAAGGQAGVVNPPAPPPIGGALLPPQDPASPTQPGGGS
jgi:hypothetical protein